MTEGASGSTSEVQAEARARDLSGRGMDRKIDRSKFRMMVGIAAGVGVLLVAAFVWAIRPAPAGHYVIDAKRLQIATVEQGMLDDFVSSLGAVAPAQTVLLTAVEGGRVEKVYADNGDVVKAGQALLDLSNTTLQLDVLARETEVQEQINSLRSKEIDLERSRLSNARNVVQAETQRDTLKRKIERSERLAAEGAYAAATLEDEKAQLVMQEEILRIAREQQETDERMGKSQMQQMRLSNERMQRNLEAARSSIDALTVRAPVAGTLTSFNPELGQSLARGASLGQIDSASDLKLTVTIDEFYLDRFSSGLPAEARIGDEIYKMSVGRVSAQVENGVFKADLIFEAPPSSSLRRGQTFQVKIVLSEASESTLIIPNGSFMTATGGRWAFVLKPDGKAAEKRDVKLGRRNATAIEVLGGLNPGEKVVVSDYAGFETAKALQIRK